MTRKHFNAIAKAIKADVDAVEAEPLEQVREISRRTLKYVSINLASNLAQFNPQFDRQRFLKACGFGE